MPSMKSSRRRLAFAALALGAAAGVIPTTTPLLSAATPPLPSCGLPSQPTRCPTAAKQSYQLPTNAVVSVATPDGSRVIAIGADANYDQIVVTATDPATGRQTYLRSYYLGGGIEFASAAITPDGRTVLATGTAYDRFAGDHPATVAVDTATGHLIWSRIAPGRERHDGSLGLTIDSHGHWAYVAGWMEETADSYVSDLVLQRLDVRTGRVSWASRIGHTDGADEFPIGVSLAAGRVVVSSSAQSLGQDGPGPYQYVAYVFSTEHGQLRGSVHWSSGLGDDYAEAAAASPDGKTVAITGYGPTGPAGQTVGVTTVLVDPQRMRIRWVATTSNNDVDLEAWTLAFTRNSVLVGAQDGTVTAASPLPYVYGYADIGRRATAIALDPHTGAQQWRTDVNDPAGTSSYVTGLAVSPNGKTVYWSGYSTTSEGTLAAATPDGYAGTSTPDDSLVIAMDAHTGGALWSGRWNPQADGLATSYVGSPVATSRGLLVFGWYGVMHPANDDLTYRNEGIMLRYAP
jgi:hypothetical protein